MNVDYRLPESVIVVQGAIDRVTDSEAGTDGLDYGTAEVDVLLTVRGDEGNGQRMLILREGRRADTDFTVELTADQRLTSVSYKSVGIGGKVIAAGATLIATIAGVAVRAVNPGPSARMLTLDQSPTPPDVEDAARRKWEGCNRAAVAHQKAYEDALRNATAQLLVARQAIVSETHPTEVARAVSRVYRLETVAAAASAEVDKVEKLYTIWRAGRQVRRTEHRSYSMSVDTLAEHQADAAGPDVSNLDGTAKRVWDELGVFVELGPADGYRTHRRTPGADSSGEDEDAGVHWRVPRPVRLWVWRRGAEGKPDLERSYETAVVDRFSSRGQMPLRSSAFGEQGGALIFDNLGAVTKVVRNDKSGLGSFVDALGGVPASLVGGLDSATKISTSLASLVDADDERRLAGLRRQVDERTKNLELKGLNATAEDFAELKRLEQQVALGVARTTLAPASVTELARVQAELGLVTARKDLEAAVRQRALDGELAAAQAEIARLTAQLQLSKLR